MSHDPNDPVDVLKKARRETGATPMKQVDRAADTGGRWINSDTERAQPGDVLGIERDGETTELGDTAESEDDRRRQVKKDAPNTRP